MLLNGLVNACVKGHLFRGARKHRQKDLKSSDLNLNSVEFKISNEIDDWRKRKMNWISQQLAKSKPNNASKRKKMEKANCLGRKTTYRCLAQVKKCHGWNYVGA